MVFFWGKDFNMPTKAKSSSSSACRNLVLYIGLPQYAPFRLVLGLSHPFPQPFANRHSTWTEGILDYFCRVVISNQELIKANLPRANWRRPKERYYKSTCNWWVCIRMKTGEICVRIFAGVGMFSPLTLIEKGLELFMPICSDYEFS